MKKQGFRVKEMAEKEMFAHQYAIQKVLFTDI